MEDQPITEPPPEEETFVEYPEAPPPPPKKYTVSGGVQTVISIAILMATLLTLWNPRRVFTTPDLASLLRENALQQAGRTQQPESSGPRVGLLAGHWQNDPGEVCADGLIEADVNLNIVNRTAQTLATMGYEVDIFPEFALELLNYRGAALVAVYSGSCATSPPPPSGFMVGTSLTTQNPEAVNRLAACLSEVYQEYTQLPFRYEVLNPDHESDHIFRDIHPDTPAVLIEVGALSTDRYIVVEQAESAANGIAAGVLCFLESAQPLP